MSLHEGGLNVQVSCMGNKWCPGIRLRLATSLVSNVNYLGMTIDEHLSFNERVSFNEHINRISHKANSIKAFLHRNIKSCPLKVKDNCYKIMVRPIMEYTYTVWSPYARKNNKILKH